MLAFVVELTYLSCGDSRRKIIYLQREASTTLDIDAWRTAFCLKDAFFNEILLLTGKDEQKNKEHSKDFVPYHLPIDGSLQFVLVVEQNGLTNF